MEEGTGGGADSHPTHSGRAKTRSAEGETGGGGDSQARHSGRAKTRSADGGGDWRRGRLTSYTQWKGQDKVSRWRRRLEEGQTHKLGTVEGPRQGQQMEERTVGGADSHPTHSGRAKTRSEDGGGDWRKGRLTSYTQWKGQDKVSRWRRLEKGQTHKLGTVEVPRQGQQMEEGTGGGADSQARHSERAKTRSTDGGGDWRRGRLTS